MKFSSTTHFENVGKWTENAQQIVVKAEDLAKKYGLNGMDAPHIAAAIISKADEFVTAERATSPLSRVTEVKVVSIN